MFLIRLGLLVGLVLPLLQACQGGSSGTTITDTSLVSSNWTWSLPPNFPTPVVPDNNFMSEEKFQLGRHLFYDKKLSGNGTFSCASCHQQNKAFTDGRKDGNDNVLTLSTGSTGQTLNRNAPSLINSAYHSTYTWVNPTLLTLEKQMETPLFTTQVIEMGVDDTNRAIILQRFKDSPEYVSLFNSAFPSEAEPIHFDNIIKSISTFQRALLTGNSKFELYQKNQTTLSASEERGLNLFNGEKAECFHCHGSFNFNDQVNFLGRRPEENLFHNTGLYNIGGDGTFPADNQGLIAFTGKSYDMGRFRAQSLWNVAITGPYMHDGSIATLEEVLDFYASGGRNITSGAYQGDGRLNPFKSEFIGLIELNTQERADIIAFLKTLTDETLLTNERFSDPFN